MKILQVCPGHYISGQGGVSEHVINISTRLAKIHNVVVYATTPKNEFPHYEFSKGVTIKRYRRFAPNNAYFFSLEMLLEFLKTEIDVVHSHGYHAFPLHFSSLIKSKRFIITPHFHGGGHTVFRNSLFRLLKPFGKKVLEKAYKIVTVSDFEKKLVCDHFGFNDNKVVTIPNGVDFNEFANLKRRRDEHKRILYVGRLEEYKGVHHLVEVLPKLPADVILEVVGKGSLRGFLEHRAKKNKVENRIFFYQDVSRKKLIEKYVNADVFILLSKYEAYSLTVAEALSAGTPCIVTNTSALSEWIDNESCFGLSFPVKNNELVKLIKKILNSDIDKKNMNKWIGTKILDWDEVVKRLEVIYN